MELSLWKNEKGKEVTKFFSAQTYIKNVIEKIEKLIGVTLRNYESPMEAKYHPELDESPTLDEAETVTLGRFDVYYATQTRRAGR